MLKGKSILKLIFVIVSSLLLTSCQTGSNMEQSSCTSESVQSSSSPEEEVTLFGKPITQINWSNAVSKDFNEPTTEEGKYIDTILRGLVNRNLIPYPDQLIQASQSANQDTCSAIDFWVDWAIQKYKNEGFNGKSIQDFPTVIQDGVKIAKIPLEDIVSCLKFYFGNIDNLSYETYVRSSILYHNENQSVYDNLWVGGSGYPNYLIHEVTMDKGNLLNIIFYSVNTIGPGSSGLLPEDWKSDITATLEICNYQSYLLQVKIFPDHWQYLKCQIFEKSA